MLHLTREPSAESTNIGAPTENTTACRQKESVGLSENHLSNKAFWRLIIELIVLNEPLPSATNLQPLASHLLLNPKLTLASDEMRGVHPLPTPVELDAFKLAVR